MTTKAACPTPYSFEQGLIRPPAEAESLLLRLTRNCPWNRCSFCPLYKNETFSIRDADSLIVKPEDLKEILTRINRYFPEVKRITSFARTRTLINIGDADLKTYADLGLNRIHSGLETGSDRILKLVDKGCTKEMHVAAGKKVRDAGIELSECVLLGLGGKELSEEHARETADVINQIDPPIIRFLTLVPPRYRALFKSEESRSYVPATELDIARETRQFLENLNGVTSFVESRNIVNLHQEVEGIMPDDQEKMIDVLTRFIDLPHDRRTAYQVGKRLGIFSRLADLNDQRRLHMVREACNQYNIDSDNADSVIREMMQRYFS